MSDTTETETDTKSPGLIGGVTGALGELKTLFGERLSDEAAYAFYYPSDFAVSSRLHSGDLPPIAWLTRVIERFGIEVIGPYLPHILSWFTAKTPGEEKLDDDDFVAATQVSGFNPLVLRRARDRAYLVSKFPGVFDWTFADNETFAEAFNDGRIYFTDYSVLSKIQPSKSQPKKQIYVPIGLFRVPNGHALEIIAIKTGQDIHSSVYRPHDDRWPQAKIIFNCADANYHEIISHLGRTHLLIEPFAVSTARIFLEEHWVRRFLEPHFAGTLNINALAFKLLINPGGSFDQLLCGDLESELKLSYDSIQHPGIRKLMIPAQLADRDVMDPRLMYPYRDDALSLWDAYHHWVDSFAAIYCKNDADVRNDIYIRNWVSDLTVGGKVSDLGEVNTRAELIDLLTMIIFTASAQHAAVNFPQASLMQFARATPLAVYGNVDTDTVEELAPPEDMRELQKKVADLLAGVYFTKIGDYAVYGIHSHSSVVPTHHPEEPLKFPHQNLVFHNDAELQALEGFRRALEDVRQVIAERNHTSPVRQRFPYWYLHPDNIPQSINI